MALSLTDPSSFSNPDQCIVTDIDLHLSVNFPKQTLSGFVDYTIDRKDLKADRVIFDTKNLTIYNVRKKNAMSKMNYTLFPEIPTFGSKLEIKLPKSNTKVFNIRIDYETSEEATALQWLEPWQTAGKIHPYLFSQCQAAHARTMLPCQDTPYVKAPYSASISVPAELTALMSAIRDGDEISGEDPNRKIFKFVQQIPIPSYLIAIVVGALESRRIGPRSHVWCEKEFIEEAAYEFAETEKMLEIAEKLCGPYVWGVYDLLILPPSFSMGGMENPCLTFVTPTVLCGDRSQTCVIAHEICHSWTGNLVTNRTFEHFWLNEGLTTFVERKICGRMQGESHRQFLAIGGLKDLEQDILALGKENPLTLLVPDLKNVDPDNSCNFVPYEKGHTLLFYLEEILGGSEEFEKFVLAYIDNFKFKSLDTLEWKAFLYEHFDSKKDILDMVDWNKWLYMPGMPPVIPNYDTTLAKACNSLSESWIESKIEDLSQFKSEDLDKMNSTQIVEFLSLLIQKAPLPKEKLEKMNDVYKIGEMRNSEICFRWSRIGLISKWEPVVPHAIEFLTKQGRMKFVRPIYRDLYKWEEKRDLCLSTFKTHSNLMYPVKYKIAVDLNVKE